MNRREQLFLLWAASATIVAMVFAGIIIVFALPRIPLRVMLGRADSFPPNSINHVDLPLEFADPLALSRTPISQRVWVVRNGVEKFTAFFARSTFHGYPVNWVPERGRFEDPALGSAWNREGVYLFGPDPRDLDRFPVAIEDGLVLIELRLIKGMSH